MGVPGAVNDSQDDVGTKGLFQGSLRQRGHPRPASPSPVTTTKMVSLSDFQRKQPRGGRVPAGIPVLAGSGNAVGTFGSSESRLGAAGWGGWGREG